MNDLLRAWVAVGCVALATPAWGWAPTQGRALGGQGEVAALAVGTWSGGPAVVLADAAWVRIVDPVTGAVLREVAGAARAVALVDHDGDGVTDLLLCGSDGVAWHSGAASADAGAATLTTEPCSALAWMEREGGARALVTAGPRILSWPIDLEGGLGAPEVLGASLGAPLLAAAADRLAYAEVGGTSIVEHSAWGRSTYAARGGVTGLVAGPRSWVWTTALAEVEDVTRRRIPVVGPPLGLRAADLEGSGALTVVVVHPDGVGVVTGGREVRHTLGRAVQDVALADLDGDGCADLVALGDGSAWVHPGRCGAPSALQRGGGDAVDVLLDRPDKVVDAFIGHPLRLRLVDPNASGTRFHWRGGPPGFVLGEDGIATYVPEAAHEGEWVVHLRLWGGPGVVRVVPLRLWVRAGEPSAASTESATLALDGSWPVVEVALGETLVRRLADADGDRRVFIARGGPRGLEVRKDGHVRYTPRAEDIGSWQVRVRAAHPGPARRSGFVLRVAPREVLQPPSEPASARAAERAGEPRERRFWEIQSCFVGFGIAAGLSSTVGSWENVGRPFEFSGSPLIAGACEGGAPRPVQWFLGGESAPLYTYLREGDRIGVHTLVGTAGVSVGSMRLRVGPYVSAGILMVGAGVRALWLPFVNRAGWQHGFELRAAWFAASAPSGQAMLLYGWRVGGPRRR